MIPQFFKNLLVIYYFSGGEAVVSTVIGGVGGDVTNPIDGTAAVAMLPEPYSVAVAPDGSIVFTERHICLRKYTPGVGVAYFSGDCFNTGIVSGSPTTTKFSFIYDMVFDSKGNLYVTDQTYIRKIDSTGK